jgi:hypothetical protein
MDAAKMQAYVHHLEHRLRTIVEAWDALDTKLSSTNATMLRVAIEDARSTLDPNPSA